MLLNRFKIRNNYIFICFVLTTFLISSIENLFPILKKILPTSFGAPFNDVKEMQKEQSKYPPTSFGAPLRDIKESQR